MGVRVRADSGEVGDGPLTDQTHTGDRGAVLTLRELIQDRRATTGWSYVELSRRSGGRLSHGRWYQLGKATRLKEFPDPSTIEAVSDVLGLDVTTVVLAAAASLSLDVRQPTPRPVPTSQLARLLPPGADQLSEEVVQGLLALIRAIVTDATTRAPRVTESHVWGMSGEIDRVNDDVLSRDTRSPNARQAGTE